MKLHRFLILLTFPLAIAGCGGAGGGNVGTQPLAATFRMDFARGVPNTSLVLFFDQSGHVGAQLNDVDQVEWVGEGNVLGSQIAMTMHPVGTGASNDVFLHGTINQGVTPTIDITLSGEVAATSTAVEIAGKDVTPFSGTYDGNYDGSETGTFSITVSVGGSITGTVNSPANGDNLPVIGAVDITGKTSFHYHTANGDSHYSGYLLLPPGSDSFTGTGSWSFGDSSGNWSGDQGPFVP